MVARGRKRLLGVISVTRRTPKTAITASPMNFSTLPPWRSTILFIRSK